VTQTSAKLGGALETRFVFTKEPYVSTKETYVSAKDPHVTQTSAELRETLEMR